MIHNLDPKMALCFLDLYFEDPYFVDLHFVDLHFVDPHFPLYWLAVVVLLSLILL